MYLPDDLIEYNKAYNKAVSKLKGWYELHSDDEQYLRYDLWNEYKKYSLDPDGKALVQRGDVHCSADAMLSIYIICRLEADISDIVSTYERYRKYPLFYFPMEMGGINQSRATVYADRIDYTLYDLKEFFEGHTKNCRLLKTYSRPLTSKWLPAVGSFGNLVKEYDIAGIFTDEDCNVINIETGEIIKEIPPKVTIKTGWTRSYYENIKKLIDAWYSKHGITL